MNRWMNRLIQTRGCKLFCDSYSFEDLGRLSRAIDSPKNTRIVISEANGINLLAKIKSAWDAGSTPVLISPKLDPFIKATCIAKLDTERAPNEAMIVFTSATSSLMPKGVILTHSNLESHLSMLDQHVPQRFLSASDRTIPMLPWTHCYGLMGECFSMMERGGRMFTGNYFFQANLRHPTVLFIVPKILEKFLEMNQKLSPYLNVWKRTRLLFGRKIRYLVSGGAPLSDDLIMRCNEELILDIYQGYGCSEMSPMISLETEFPNTQGSELLPGIQLKFEGEEILVNGPNRFYGYLGEPPLPPDEFYRTGDLGRFVSENRLEIVGRSACHVKLKNGYFIDLSYEEERIKKLLGTQFVSLWEDKGELRGVVYGSTANVPPITGLMKIETKPTLENGMLTIKGEMRRQELKRLYNSVKGVSDSQK